MAVGFVQSANNDAEASAATIAATYDGAVGAGNLLICFVTWGDVEGTPTCSDSVNGAWTAAGNQLWSTNVNQGLKAFVFPNTAAGTPTVTVSFGAGRAFRGLVIAEYSGVRQSSPVDVVGERDDGLAGSGADNASTAAFTPAVAGQLIVSSVVDIFDGAPVAAGTNYTEREDATSAPGDNTQNFNICDRIDAPAGSQQAFFSIVNAGEYHALAVVLFPAATEMRPWIE